MAACQDDSRDDEASLERIGIEERWYQKENLGVGRQYQNYRGALQEDLGLDSSAEEKQGQTAAFKDG
ncbi:MAG: hypothetical protein ACREBQ_05155 [Nitrososphaerales archaeon]